MSQTLIPEDWREWPGPQKMRLRWRLQTELNPEHPRPEQLTPGRHALCKQPVADCEKALADAEHIKFDEPEDRMLWLEERGHIEWLIWLILTGRGWGKTRTGAEDIAKWCRENPKTRVALIAGKFTDVRDIMVEGESGLLNVLHPSELLGGSKQRAWNRSLGELLLANGCILKAYSCEKPDQLRGPQHHRAWADELAKWENLKDTWSNLMFGLRLGPNPQCVVTTTPRPLKMIKDLRSRVTTVVTKGTMRDNVHNLSPAAVAELTKQYGGSRLGRQELEGELLEEAEGALWKASNIEENRHNVDLSIVRKADMLYGLDLVKAAVAIDPAVTSGEESDDTGIIMGGISANDGHAYVLEDRTCHVAPLEWAKRSVNTYYDYECDRVIGEVNNGGDLVETTIHTVDPRVPYEKVWASRGKRIRAQPVASLYEQGRVHHVNVLDELEDEMTNWDPESGEDSPNRMDACVWLITHLFNLDKQNEIKVLGRAHDTRYAGRR